MVPTFSLLAVPEVVVMTTSGAASDDKVGILLTFTFQVYLMMPQNIYGNKIEWKELKIKKKHTHNKSPKLWCPKF